MGIGFTRSQELLDGVVDNFGMLPRKEVIAAWNNHFLKVMGLADPLQFMFEEFHVRKGNEAIICPMERQDVGVKT